MIFITRLTEKIAAIFIWALICVCINTVTKVFEVLCSEFRHLKNYIFSKKYYTPIKWIKYQNKSSNKKSNFDKNKTSTQLKSNQPTVPSSQAKKRIPNEEYTCIFKSPNRFDIFRSRPNLREEIENEIENGKLIKNVKLIEKNKLVKDKKRKNQETCAENVKINKSSRSIDFESNFKVLSPKKLDFSEEWKTVSSKKKKSNSAAEYAKLRSFVRNPHLKQIPHSNTSRAKSNEPLPKHQRAFSRYTAKHSKLEHRNINKATDSFQNLPKQNLDSLDNFNLYNPSISPQNTSFETSDPVIHNPTTGSINKTSPKTLLDMKSPLNSSNFQLQSSPSSLRYHSISNSNMQLLENLSTKQHLNICNLTTETDYENAQHESTNDVTMRSQFNQNIKTQNNTNLEPQIRILNKQSIHSYPIQTTISATNVQESVSMLRLPPIKSTICPTNVQTSVSMLRLPPIKSPIIPTNVQANVSMLRLPPIKSPITSSNVQASVSILSRSSINPSITQQTSSTNRLNIQSINPSNTLLRNISNSHMECHTNPSIKLSITNPSNIPSETKASNKQYYNTNLLNLQLTANISNRRCPNIIPDPLYPNATVLNLRNPNTSFNLCSPNSSLSTIWSPITSTSHLLSSSTITSNTWIPNIGISSIWHPNPSTSNIMRRNISYSNIWNPNTSSSHLHHTRSSTNLLASRSVSTNMRRNAQCNNETTSSQ